MKLLGKSYRKQLRTLEWTRFLNKTPKAEEMKAKRDKWNYIKLKSFCTAMKQSTEIKEPPEWGEIFAYI
jgi:hypothetical protein